MGPGAKPAELPGGIGRKDSKLPAEQGLLARRPTLSAPQTFRESLVPGEGSYPRYLLWYRWHGSTVKDPRIKPGLMDLPRLFGAVASCKNTGQPRIPNKHTRLLLLEKGIRPAVVASLKLKKYAEKPCRAIGYTL